MCLGIPGQIVELVDEDSALVTVEVGGVRRAVNVALIVDDQHRFADCLGDWVLVHVGFAMTRLDPREAALTLALLRELGEAPAAESR